MLTSILVFKSGKHTINMSPTQGHPQTGQIHGIRRQNKQSEQTESPREINISKSFHNSATLSAGTSQSDNQMSFSGAAACDKAYWLALRCRMQIVNQGLVLCPLH